MRHFAIGGTVVRTAFPNATVKTTPGEIGYIPQQKYLTSDGSEGVSQGRYPMPPTGRKRREPLARPSGWHLTGTKRD
jgi:hypothetical protein